MRTIIYFMEKLQKIAFPKQTNDIRVEDLGLTYADGVVFRFWSNPSRSVIRTITKVLASPGETLADLDREEQDKLMDDFYRAISLFIIDTNLEELDFRTPEATKESFESDAMPYGFIYEVVLLYILRELSFSDRLKKVLGLLPSAENSGTGNEQKATKSKKE